MNGATVGEPLAAVHLTEAAASALRLAIARLRPNEPLSTLDVLLALEACDSAGAWARFLIDGHGSDPNLHSIDTWEGVPLTHEAAAALSRARRIGEAYDLIPLPLGALALAMVWDPSSAAARAFVGIDHEQLLGDLQDDVLGFRLNGLKQLDTVPPRHLDDPPVLSDREAFDSLAEVTPLLSAGFLRILTVAAAFGVWFSLTSASAWQFVAKDDLLPPIQRATIASAIPSTDSMDKLLGLELVRDHDGLPKRRVFDSTLPIAWDLRHEVIDSAWAGHWAATNGRAEVDVELASTLVDYTKTKTVTRYVNDCVPAGARASSEVVRRSGFVTRTDNFASFCSLERVGQTQILVRISTFEPPLIPNLNDHASAIVAAVSGALPAPRPAGELKATFSTPYITAQTRKAWLSVVALIPMIWLLPTLLMDRAFWQRVRWSILLRRFTTSSHSGWDIDSVVRARIWSSALGACLQTLAAVWVLRTLWDSERWRGLVRSVADRVGWVLAGPMDLAVALAAVLFVGMVPRLLQKRRTRGLGAFAGGRRMLWAAGIGLSLVTLVAAYLMMSLGVATSALGTGGGSDFAQQRLSAALRIASIPLTVAAVAPMALMRRFAMRALRTRELLDRRPPILLLRSFVDDAIKVRSRGNQRRSLIDRLSLRRWERFEEVIAAALAVQGPVEAVGQVGQRLPPPLGAVRRQFTNEEWQYKVNDLMGEAPLICITLGRSDSLAWEIERIAELGYLGKTVFVLPPTKRGEHINRLAVLAELLELSWADLDVQPSHDWALAVRVSAKGNAPEVIRARAQEDVAYDIALEIMRLRILGWTWQSPSLAAEPKSKGPRAQIHPLGKAPKTKTWWRRPWLLVALVNVTGAATLPIVFLTGGDAKTSAFLDLGSAAAWDVAADPGTGDMYALLNGDKVYRITVKGDDSHPDLEGRSVARIDTADYLTADNGWLIATNDVAGTMQGLSPGSSSVTWKRDDLPGVRHVVGSGTRLYVVLPSERRVLLIDRATGKTLDEGKVDGIPWAVAVSGNQVAVALASENTIVMFEADHLYPAGTIVTTSASTAITAAAGDLWAYHPSEHVLEAVAGPQRGDRIATRSEQPVFASNGSIFAIGGVEMVTTLRPTGQVHRNVYLLRHPATMAVTRAGDVLAATGNTLVFVRASLG